MLLAAFFSICWKSGGCCCRRSWRRDLGGSSGRIGRNEVAVDTHRAFFAAESEAASPTASRLPVCNAGHLSSLHAAASPS
ncbi:hypothetical protein BDZ90DRAFT_230977 [Jaminaea rosea]|uniref:Secreted protein n=1 Tax=Jaminaea rosea TaxID=1569628 RepID=A0A316UW04_9BASI|nr:hypothetical protein BDZ90DRAFT_230977 [Jaminaea rosea]PWN28978.1 hypothetical protein BDZ90DRAFT_230977 [Jaminaea rosea]